MLVYGLRLLVALITFGVGIVSAVLLGSERAHRIQWRRANGGQVFVLKAQEEIPRSVEGKYGCKLSLGNESAPVEGGLLNGKELSKPVLVYPAEARAAGVQGTVRVRVTVDESGEVTSAIAVGGPSMLRRAAEDAALRTRLAPTLLSGRPVQVRGVLEYRFALP